MSLYFILGICLMVAPFVFIYVFARDAQAADRSRYNPSEGSDIGISPGPGM